MQARIGRLVGLSIRVVVEPVASLAATVNQLGVVGRAALEIDAGVLCVRRPFENLQRHDPVGDVFAREAVSSGTPDAMYEMASSTVQSRTQGAVSAKPRSTPK